jgi:hypothetical protein
MLAAAKKRFEPYKNLNLLALAKDPNISAEELGALQQAYNAAPRQRALPHAGAWEPSSRSFRRRKQELAEQAAETVKVLSDPEKGIPGFSEKLYGDMMSYAKSQGVT